MNWIHLDGKQMTFGGVSGVTGVVNYTIIISVLEVTCVI